MCHEVRLTTIFTVLAPVTVLLHCFQFNRILIQLHENFAKPDHHTKNTRTKQNFIPLLRSATLTFNIYSFLCTIYKL